MILFEVKTPIAFNFKDRTTDTPYSTESVFLSIEIEEEIDYVFGIATLEDPYCFFESVANEDFSDYKLDSIDNIYVRDQLLIERQRLKDGKLTLQFEVSKELLSYFENKVLKTKHTIHLKSEQLKTMEAL